MMQQRYPQPYRYRLWVALRALMWWKPWYSYYGMLSEMQWYAHDQHEQGWKSGYYQGHIDEAESYFDFRAAMRNGETITLTIRHAEIPPLKGLHSPEDQERK